MGYSPRGQKESDTAESLNIMALGFPESPPAQSRQETQGVVTQPARSDVL